MEKFENRVPFEGFGYGRNGTPTQKALEDAVAAIEGAHRSIAVQSGLAAVTGAIVGFLKTGDHMLLTDNCLRSGAPLRQHHAQGLRRRDDLLRSDDRRRHREADQAQHQGRLSRGAGLADLRGAGRRHDRGDRQEARRGGADRQHLGDPALLQAVRPWLRSVDPRRHQVHRRPFRRDDGHHLLPRPRDVRDRPRRRARTSASMPRPTTAISRCAACAPWPCACAITRRAASTSPSG